MLSLTVKDLQCLQNNWCISLDTYPTLWFGLCSRLSLTCVWHRTMGELKLEVDVVVVVVVVFIYIFIKLTNAALRLATFLLVSCQITSVFSLPPVKETLFLLTTGKKYNCCWICRLCVQGYKAEASWATINIETSLLTFYIYISLELEIDLKLAERRQAVWKASPGGRVVGVFFSWLRLTFS